MIVYNSYVVKFRIFAIPAFCIKSNHHEENSIRHLGFNVVLL